MTQHDDMKLNDSPSKDPTKVEIDKKDEKNPNAGKSNDATEPEKKNGAQSQGGGFNLAGKIQDGIDAANSFVSSTVSVACDSKKILQRAPGFIADKSSAVLTTIKETVMGKKIENSAPKGPSPSDDGGPKNDKDDSNRHGL